MLELLSELLIAYEIKCNDLQYIISFSCTVRAIVSPSGMSLACVKMFILEVAGLRSIIAVFRDACVLTQTIIRTKNHATMLLSLYNVTNMSTNMFLARLVDKRGRPKTSLNPKTSSAFLL